MSWTEKVVNRLAGKPKVEADGATTRRGFLTGATLAGTALVMDPLNYLTKPADAYASVCGSHPNCNDGYSAFCCTINNGRNTCPPNTFAGGWWKTDRSSFCGGGARYYIDCNALPGSSFRCRCANNGSCDKRRVACNVFRYGQCNTQIKGVTAVVCRQISCRPPWQLYPGRCGTSSATDPNTATHSAPCLTKANTFPALKTYPKAPSVLRPNTPFKAGMRLTSPDRHTTVVFTTKGRLVVKNHRGVVWSSRTAPEAAGGFASLSVDGNLRVRDAAKKVRWQTGPAPRKASWRLVLRNSGDLQIWDGNRYWWHTNTRTH